MSKRLLSLCILLCGLFVVVGCGPRTTVIWISIDGFRHDYPEKAKTPFLHELMGRAYYSRAMTPITPSITFPSHVSEATGVTVDRHGIANNDFYDTETRQSYSFPAVPALLQSEPIWITTTRQHVRTLVFDWPLSQNQTARIRSDYFLAKFEGAPTDEQRLNRLIETWQLDKNKKPLGLIMGYIKKTDTTGHKFGPESAELRTAIQETDAALAHFVSAAQRVFAQKSRKGDRLYLMLTTDHGMTEVSALVNLEKLFAAPLPKSVHVETGGPVAMIYLHDVPPAQRTILQQSLLNDLRKYSFLTAYTRDTLPKAWGFYNPARTGDVVVMLKNRYTFSTKIRTATAPAKGTGPLGMHGYPPAENPDMRGFFLLARLDQVERARDLGPVDSLRIHPTVAKLLHVKPAPNAKARPLPVP
ncbi:MAG TPA: nucleotide pyrophosphatase/phosphodiesterase family protein [Tepidisphaeraceae bacterium]|jgi:alkaline phosphatase D